MTRTPQMLWIAAALLWMLMCLAGCASSQRVADPVAELRDLDASSSRQLAAMKTLVQRGPDEACLQTLRSIVHVPGYAQAVREAAVQRLIRFDPDGLKRTIELRLPMLAALEWRQRLCEIIAENGWKDLSPTLVRAWAVPIGQWAYDEFVRPEYLALAALHGNDRVIDEVFAILVESSGVAQQGLRARCWTLLMRLGERNRLRELIAGGDFDASDSMMQDLQAGLNELGILPSNIEEILWLRRLRQPEHAAFWSQARQAMSQLDPAVAESLELRNLPVIVAAWLHEPAALETSHVQLFDEIGAALADQKRYTVSFDGFVGNYPQTLNGQKAELTWGDLAAIRMAIRACTVPQVVAHLFDHAQRDQRDRATEYGGLMRLDERNRFEIIEYQPRVRQADNRFDAPQEMFDASYTALFHFHLHAQKYDNARYAGPHLGDLTYADNTRANCLVLTFIDRDTMNVDFYRHGRVMVDLGEIHR